MHGNKKDRVYQFILDYMTTHNGLAPTLREIRDGAEISSTSVVSYLLDELVEDGLLVRSRGGSRRIQLAGSHWTPPVLRPDAMDELALQISNLSYVSGILHSFICAADDRGDTVFAQELREIKEPISDLCDTKSREFLVLAAPHDSDY